MAKVRTDKRPFTARELAKKFNCSQQTIRNFWAMPREEYERNSYARTQPWEHFGISRATWYRRGKPMPEHNTQEQ